MNLSHLIITTALGLTALVPDVDPSCQRHPDDLDHLVYKLAKPDICEPPGPSRGNGVRPPDPSHGGGRAEELTVSRAWLSLGKALMAGLGCQDRHDCPGKLSCNQVVEQAVRQPPQSRREQRHTHTHDFEGIFSGDLDTYPITDPQGQKKPETSQHSHNLRKRSPQQASGVIPHAGGFLLYDDTLNGIEGQLTISNPDSSGSSEDGVGISNTAAFGNQPGNVLGQFYQQQSGGGAETEPYHMLPPHPQSPWWEQQDQMYGQQVHNGQLPSQGGYAENSPEEFRANNHRQGGFQATRGNSANQWNANKDRRRSGDSEDDERKEDADDDDDDDNDDDDDRDDDDYDNDDDDNETDYSAHKTWSRPAGRDGKGWGLSETEDNEKEVHETSMHSDSSTTEWDSRAWDVSAAVEHGEEVLNTTQSESSSDQTSTEEQSIPKPATHQASTEESSSAKPTTEGISSVRPEPTSGRTQTSERSTHTSERAPRRYETQTSPTFTVRAGRYNTQNSTSSNRTNTGMTERDETQLSSTQSLTSTDTVSHETTVTLNTTEKHKAFMRNNTAGHRPSRSRSNHKAKRRRKQKASEAPEEQQTRGSKGRRRRRRKKRPQTQESGEDTSGRIQITTTAVELTTTNDVENGNETDAEKRSPHHNEVSGGSQHYSRNRVSERPSSSEWGQNRFNEDRNSDNNNSTSEEDSDENDYDDKENHRDENGHEHANNHGQDHHRASSPRNGKAHGGNSGGRGHRTTARLPSPGRRVTTGLQTKGRMTTSSLPSTTVPSQTPPETSATLPQTTTTVPSTDASPRTPTTPPTPSVSSPDSSPSGVPTAAVVLPTHHSPPQGHRPERGRPHPGANHPEEHPPFNHSAIASRLLFAAVEQMVNEKCPEEPEDHVSSPRAWVDRVCSEVESTRSSGSLIVQRAVTSLEIKLLKALDKWNPERFLSHTAGVGDEDFVPQHKCFSVHALATNSATRLHSVNAENCHRDLHDFIARLSSAIVTNLLQGQRHGSDHEPCQFDFVSQLFFNFGDREAGCDYGHVMPVAGVQHLLDSIQKRNCSKGGQGQTRNQTHNLSADPEPVSRNNWSLNKHEHHQRSNDDAAKSKRNTWAVSENMYVYHKHSARELVNIVLKNESDSLTMPQFYQLCPSLLQQIWLTSHSDDFYLQEDHDHDHFDRAEVDDGVAASAIQTYGLGTAAVAVITVCSLLGAVMVRLCRGVGRHYAIACMMALAVGNLCGDAILHLIPEAFSLGHDHGSHDNHNDNHEDESMYRLSGGFVVNDVRLKCLALLGSVYLFWLLEIFTSRYHECVQPGSGKKTVAKEPSVSTISGDYNGAQSIPMSSLAEMTEVTLSGQTRDRESTYEIITPQVLGQAKPVVTEIAEFKASSRHLVWMIVVGDAVHNLADGLAIGAAFAHSIPLGLSTSMAVVCHEIPHELGDFAVLMSTGMKMRKALLLNLLSALTAFVGLYIGLGIGAQLAHRQWIFIIVAGMFLYVSLADLVPELIRYFRHFRNFRMFILQSVGLLSGFALMFLLVLLEDVLHF